MVSSALLFVIALCVVASNASVVPGACPVVTLQQDFDIQGYLGQWFQYQAFESPNEFGRCDYENWTDNLNETYGVVESTVNPSTNLEEQVLGYARLNSETGEGQLAVTYPEYSKIPLDYLILGTDYTGFAVIFSCKVDGENSIQTSWLVTRERQPSASVLAAAQAVIDANGLDSSLYIVTDQSNCA